MIYVIYVHCRIFHGGFYCRLRRVCILLIYVLIYVLCVGLECRIIIDGESMNDFYWIDRIDCVILQTLPPAASGSHLLTNK